MKHLSKEKLIAAFLLEVKKEKITTANVIRYIQEIDSRRLYLDFKCTSLFQFLVEHAKYSRSAAQRRIDAARLASQVPQVAESLESGEINLTQASQIQQMIREKEKTHKIALKTKSDMVTAVKNKTTEATEKTLCVMLEIKPKVQEKARIQADESIRQETTFTKEENAILNRVKELLSHKNPNPSFKDLVMELANSYLKRNAPEEKALVTTLEERPLIAAPKERPVSTAAGVKTTHPRFIPKRTKTYLFQTQKHCQHRHADGSICASRFRLEVDHIRPVYKGGTNDLSNLQILCDQHNRQKYRDGLGI